MRIVIAGATGLIGSVLIDKLDKRDVTRVGRPVEQWPALVAQAEFDIAICTLGTTIKAAGSQDAFAAVDRDAVVAFAKAARQAGARQLLIVTSVGANAASSNFYLRTKGQAEAAISALGFERVDIFRPGLLRGKRSGAARPGETLAKAVSPITDLLTPSVFDQYRSIAADDVAKAMTALVGVGYPGIHIHHNRDMLREATRLA